MWYKKTNAKHIKIQLLEPLVFVGMNLDSLPVLRGTIEINLENKIKNLDLSFQGIMKTNHIQESEMKIIAQSQMEVPINSTKKYAFEMPLSAGIPETVDSAHINVSYQLSVKLNYFSKKSTIIHEELNKPIILVRLPEAGENHSTMTLDSHKYYSNWCHYRITLDKRAIAIGSKLPVKIELAPTVNELRLKQVIVRLVEKCTIASTEASPTYQSVRYMYPANGQRLTLPARPITKQWETSCVYQIPNEKKLSHSTQEYKSFHISHNLLISLVISVPNSQKFNTYGQGRLETKTVSFQTDIDLLNSHLSNCNWSLHCNLPPYNSSLSNEENLNSHQSTLSPPTYEDTIVYSSPLFGI